MTYDLIKELSRGSIYVILVMGGYLWSRSDPAVRSITVLFLVGTASIVLQRIIAANVGNNMFVFHLYTAVSMTVLAAIFMHWHSGLAARLIKASLVLYYALHIGLLLAGVEQLALPDKWPMQFEAVFVALLVNYTLLTAFRDYQEGPILRAPKFWFLMGLFTIFTIPVIVFASIPTYITKRIWWINHFSNFVGNLAVIAAYYFVWRETANRITAPDAV